MKKTQLQKVILEVLKEDNWMKDAFNDPKKKGALHKSLGVPEDKPIPDSRVDSELSGIHSKVDRGQKLTPAELTKQRSLQATKNAKKANEDTLLKSIDEDLYGAEPSIGEKIKIYGGKYKGKAGKIIGAKFQEYFTVDIPKIGKVKIAYKDVFNFSSKTNEQVIEDEIPGGKGDDANEADFDPKEVEMGKKIEMEHTGDPVKAKEITLDHLTEDPKYYTKLNNAGLADELKSEAIRKEIRSIIKEYYDDEQSTKFVDAVLGLLHAAKNALSSNIEKSAETYYSQYFRTAQKRIETLNSTTKFLKLLTTLK